MSLRDASDRSQTLVDSLRATFQQINKLSKEPNPELAQDIHETLKHNETTLELLQQDAEDFAAISDRTHNRDTDRARESARLSAQVARLAEDLKHARSQYRRAQLSAKRKVEQSKQQERETHLSALKKAYSSDKPPGTTADLFAARRPQNKQLTEDELLVNTSSDITAALRQTHDRLTSELSRSTFAQETLVQSTAALSDLGERYSNLDTLLTNSKTLLGTLVRSQKSDTWYLETAFYILVATLCWLVFRRIIYGPGWWLVWLPFKFLILQPFVFLIKAFGGSPDGVEALQSSTGSVTRPPLIIQPSATGGSPRYPGGPPKGGQRVGLGGTGAKLGKQGETRQQEQEAARLSEQIAKMVEKSRQEAAGREGDTGEAQNQDGEVRRADGTVLQDRGDIKPNPKKKVFDMDVEEAKLATQQAQAQEAQQPPQQEQQQGQEIVHDEL